MFPRYRLFTLLTTLLLAALLLSACQAANNAAVNPPPAQPTQAVVQPLAPTQPPAPAANAIALDPAGEIVPAVQPGPDQIWWGPMPQHTRMKLVNYPVTDRETPAQIYIYPLAELPKYNENGARAAADLNALLQSRQPSGDLPYLPLTNAKQSLHARVKFMDFKNGKGVAYLTQYNQGPVLVNNSQLVYTFQGLTSDNKYYIAAVLPVTHPELPGTQKVYSENADDLKNYPDYMNRMNTVLSEKPDGSFTPDLSVLDALMQSLEVK